MTMFHRATVFVFMAAALMAGLSAWAAGEICVVADPTGTPLNVRTAPNFKIIDAVANGLRVRILQVVKGNGDGKDWAFIAALGQTGGLGWVYRRYLVCS